jgi:hypothetical protein
MLVTSNELGSVRRTPSESDAADQDAADQDAADQDAADQDYERDIAMLPNVKYPRNLYVEIDYEPICCAMMEYLSTVTHPNQLGLYLASLNSFKEKPEDWCIRMQSAILARTTLSHLEDIAIKPLEISMPDRKVFMFSL